MNNEGRDRLEEIPFNELILACTYEGCSNILEYTIENPAKDPVDVWAKSVSALARSEGWTTGKFGNVLCPEHSTNSTNSTNSGDTRFRDTIPNSGEFGEFRGRNT